MTHGEHHKISEIEKIMFKSFCLQSLTHPYSNDGLVRLGKFYNHPDYDYILFFYEEFGILYI